MADDVDGRGGRRWLVLLVLVAAAAAIAWSRRGQGEVALGNIGAVRSLGGMRTRALPPSPTRTSAPPVAATADPVSELPGAAAPLPDGSAPGPEYTIKGNSASMLFHLPSSPYYERTKAALWFRTPEDARAAGFTEWKPKRRTNPPRRS